MSVHKLLLPHLNACKHGYAHDSLNRLKTGKATRDEINAELNKRIDEKEVRRILNELRKK